MTQAITRPPPRQARAEEKRAKILKAAESLLAVDGVDAVTTKTVARKADVPIGSVYRYFANVDAMLTALFDDFNAETLRTLSSMSAVNSDWREDVRQVFLVIKAMHARHPAYGPLMTYLGRTAETDDTMLRLLTERVLAARPSATATEAEEIAAMVIGIVEAAERRFYMLRDERRHDAFGEAEKAIEAYLSLYLTN